FVLFLFLFHSPAPTQLYTLSLHDALPISAWGGGAGCGAASSIPTACLTRSIRPTWAGSGTGSGAGGSGSGWATTTRSPVHSRNFPHDPQNVSLSSLWCPHCLQTITRLSPPQHPVLSIV